MTELTMDKVKLVISWNLSCSRIWNCLTASARTCPVKPSVYELFRDTPRFLSATMKPSAPRTMPKSAF